MLTMSMERLTLSFSTLGFTHSVLSGCIDCPSCSFDVIIVKYDGFPIGFFLGVTFKESVDK